MDFSASNAQGIEAGRGKYSKSEAISLFRSGRLFQIAPGESFTALTDGSTRIDALPLNGIVVSTGEAFVILDSTKIIQFSVVDDTVDASYTVTLANAHSAHTTLTGKNSEGKPVSDILAYKNNTDEYILFSWDDNTDGDVGRMLKDGTGQDDDFLSTATGGAVLTKGVPHVMRIGPDGNVYITNGSSIIQLNINTGVVDMTALSLGVGFIATGLELYGGYLVIVGYQATGYITGVAKGEARCWFWDTCRANWKNINRSRKGSIRRESRHCFS